MDQTGFTAADWAGISADRANDKAKALEERVSRIERILILQYKLGASDMYFPLAEEELKRLYQEMMQPSGIGSAQ